MSTFLAFRAFRIFPALFVEVTLSALLLGPLFTRLLLHEYFSNSQFFRYFGNIIGWITFYLPGVFETNRYDIVNANLWTLPSEFDCYFITALLMLTGAISRKTFCTAALAIVTVVFVFLNTFSSFAITPFVYSGYTITYYFFVGMLFYHWKDQIPARWWLFAVSAGASYIFMYFKHSIFLAPMFVVYCVVFLRRGGNSRNRLAAESRLFVWSLFVRLSDNAGLLGAFPFTSRSCSSNGPYWPSVLTELRSILLEHN